jgi:hypothetical protein
MSRPLTSESNRGLGCIVCVDDDVIPHRDAGHREILSPALPIRDGNSGGAERLSKGYFVPFNTTIGTGIDPDSDTPNISNAVAPDHQIVKPFRFSLCRIHCNAPTGFGSDANGFVNRVVRNEKIPVAAVNHQRNPLALPVNEGRASKGVADYPTGGTLRGTVPVNIVIEDGTLEPVIVKDIVQNGATVATAEPPLAGIVSHPGVFQNYPFVGTVAAQARGIAPRHVDPEVKSGNNEMFKDDVIDVVVEKEPDATGPSSA